MLNMFSRLFCVVSSIILRLEGRSIALKIFDEFFKRVRVKFDAAGIVLSENCQILRFDISRKYGRLATG